MRTTDPQAVLKDLQDAIAAEVDAVVRDRVRTWRIQNAVLYALVIVLLVGTSYFGAKQINFNQKTIAQLCEVAKTQRSILEQQATNTESYLKSAPGMEHNGLNDYIRKFSVPQLQLRLKTEQTPPACRSDSLRVNH